MTTKPSITLADLLEKGTASLRSECLAPPSNHADTLAIRSAPCVPEGPSNRSQGLLDGQAGQRMGTDWAHVPKRNRASLQMPLI